MLRLSLEIRYPLENLEDNFQQIDYPVFDTQINQTVPFQKNEQNPGTNVFDTHQVEIADNMFLPTAQLESPRTYSFQESTFGR